MKLRKLFKNLPVEIRASKDIDLTGLSHYSKRVVPGHLFIARKGLKHDGENFIEEAVHNGASAVLSSYFNPFLKLTQIIHPCPEQLEALLACRFYDKPSEELLTIATTGTSGKTTVCSILQQAFNRLKQTCGYIGTVGYDTGRSRYDADHTTPDAITLQRLLREMVTNECKVCVLEATSHGLDQGRLNHIQLDIGIFTNLSHEHLDYHQDMAHYAKAKAKLFDSEGLAQSMRMAIVNMDDPYCNQVMASYKGAQFSYGQDPRAQLHLVKMDFNSSQTSFELAYQGKHYTSSSQLIGTHNMMNILAAIACLLALNYKMDQALNAVGHVQNVKGRLQKPPSSYCHVYIDFAHKPDALEHALKTLRQAYPKSKIICVFGCGGERDHTKRPLMGALATRLSNYTIITSDNPRHESAEEIIDQIVKGACPGAPIESIVDRRRAIYRALELATEQDVVLIAGKGHETYQIIGSRINNFDDSQIAQEWLQAHSNAK